MSGLEDKNLGSSRDHALAIGTALEVAYDEALTPSAGTKAAYLGEFSFTHEYSGFDDDGQEFDSSIDVLVPWTTIKDIMGAIKVRALSGAEQTVRESSRDEPNTSPPLDGVRERVEEIVRARFEAAQRAARHSSVVPSDLDEELALILEDATVSVLLTDLRALLSAVQGRGTGEAFTSAVDGDTPLQAAAREAGWALSTLVDEIDWSKRPQVAGIAGRLATALLAPDEAATLRTRVEELTADLLDRERALAVCRQSLIEQAAARADPDMPILTAEVRQTLRDNAEATYALAEDHKERVEAHGLSLLLDWQDRAALGRADAPAEGSSGREALAEGREHLTITGKFQSDKYRWAPAGFVPLKTSDPMARDLLATYAERRRAVDDAFAVDLLDALSKADAPAHGEGR